MKMRVLRNWLMLKGLSFFGPAKILLSKPIRRRLFRHGAQRLGALLLQTCRSLLKTLIYQRLLLPLKSVKTQSSRRAREKAPFSCERLSRPRALGEHEEKSTFSCERFSRPRALGEQGEKAAFSYERLSRPRAPGEHGEKASFYYERLSRPRALGEHGEKVAISCERLSRPRALGQQGA
jgi:hypothetical protein